MLEAVTNRRLAVVQIDWNVMVTKSALLLGLAMLAEVSAAFLATNQLRPSPVPVMIALLAVVGAGLACCGFLSEEPGRVVVAHLVPSSFPVGGNRVERSVVVDVAASRRIPGQKSVLAVVAGADAHVATAPDRQP